LVPQEPLTIARSFNCGQNPQNNHQSRRGDRGLQNETTKTKADSFRRPCGTNFNATDNPQLKLRAIFGMSRWDKAKHQIPLRYYRIQYPHVFMRSFPRNFLARAAISRFNLAT